MKVLLFSVALMTPGLLLAQQNGYAAPILSARTDKPGARYYINGKPVNADWGIRMSGG